MSNKNDIFWHRYAVGPEKFVRVIVQALTTLVRRPFLCGDKPPWARKDGFYAGLVLYVIITLDFIAYPIRINSGRVAA